jgi:hypothetical protein
MDDIKDLVNAFLDRIAENTGQPRKKISREAVRMLMLKTYSWPGNVRELENFIERAVALGTGETLEPIDFPSQLSAHVNLHRISTSEPSRRPGRVLPIAEVERHAILNTVAEAKGDKLLAARMLGIGKTMLYRKLRQYERGGPQSSTPINLTRSDCLIRFEAFISLTTQNLRRVLTLKPRASNSALPSSNTQSCPYPATRRRNKAEHLDGGPFASRP